MIVLLVYSKAKRRPLSQFFAKLLPLLLFVQQLLFLTVSLPFLVFFCVLFLPLSSSWFLLFKRSSKNNKNNYKNSSCATQETLAEVEMKDHHQQQLQ